MFRKMVELDAGNPLPHLRLAEACCRVQSLDEAIESFWTAAELLLNLERSDDALKVVERILHFRQDARFARVAAELYLEDQPEAKVASAIERGIPATRWPARAEILGGEPPVLIDAAHNVEGAAASTSLGTPACSM